MREILFRGKVLKTNKWVYGSCNLENTLASISGCAVIPKTIGQYTGLKDKNGRRVFEADILSIKCADEKSRPYPVYFGTYNVDGFGNDFHIGFYTKHFGEDISLGFLADSNGPTDFEVIGNIFDNPELLEGDKT